MTIADLNSLESTQFVSANRWTFEHSPWVNIGIRRRPTTS
jgi:2-oxo-4-hydroxy-4-carboxy--5-ureidoimidazoline (OHCU) decarboxylase